MALMIAPTIPMPTWIPSWGSSPSANEGLYDSDDEVTETPNPMARTIWPANHPATRPTTSMIRRSILHRLVLASVLEGSSIKVASAVRSCWNESAMTTS